MMTCDRIRERFSDYLDGELLEAEQPALEGHLASCASCREEWGRFRATVDAVRTLPQHVAPRDIADAVRDQLERSRLLETPATVSRPRASRWRKPVFAFAAAAVVLVLVRAGFEQREARAPESGLAPAEDASIEFGRKGGGLAGSWQVPAPTPVPIPVSPPVETQAASLAESAVLDPVPDAAPAPVPDFAMGGDPAFVDGKDRARTVDEAGLKAPATPAASVSPADRGGPLVAWVMPCKDTGADVVRLREALAPMASEIPAVGGEFVGPRVLRFRVRASQVADAGRLLEAMGARASAPEPLQAKATVPPAVPPEASGRAVVDRKISRDQDQAVLAAPAPERESLRALKTADGRFEQEELLRAHGGLRDDKQDYRRGLPAQTDSEASKGKLAVPGRSEASGADAMETNAAKIPQEKLTNDLSGANLAEAEGEDESGDWVVLEITLTEPAVP